MAPCWKSQHVRCLHCLLKGSLLSWGLTLYLSVYQILRVYIYQFSRMLWAGTANKYKFTGLLIVSFTGDYEIYNMNLFKLYILLCLAFFVNTRTCYTILHLTNLQRKKCQTISIAPTRKPGVFTFSISYVPKGLLMSVGGVELQLSSSLLSELPQFW